MSVGKTKDLPHLKNRTTESQPTSMHFAGKRTYVPIKISAISLLGNSPCGAFLLDISSKDKNCITCIVHVIYYVYCTHNILRGVYCKCVCALLYTQYFARKHYYPVSANRRGLNCGGVVCE